MSESPPVVEQASQRPCPSCLVGCIDFIKMVVQIDLGTGAATDWTSANYDLYRCASCGKRVLIERAM